MKKFLIILWSALCFTLVINGASAKTLGQLESELASKKAEYESNQSKKAMTEAEKNKVQNELSSIAENIEKTNKEIDNLNNDIVERNKEIKSMEKEIKSIVSYYQINSSESTWLSYIFGASSFTDFIYRMSVSEQLSDYRNNKINEYNKLIKENEKKISEMNTKKEELKTLEKQQQQKYSSLQTELEGITTVGVSIKDEISDLEDEVKLYKNTYKCSSSEQISTCISRHTSSNNSGSSSYAQQYNVPSSSGFYLPITDWTRVYPFHHHDNGLDLSTSEGHAVTPIADGVVIDIWRQYKCGGNMVWIAHNVNGKKYTSAYFHLKTINVSLDQQVTHNTVIGYSGGAKKGTSTNTYDSCTTGPHLHLQVSYGNYSRTSYSTSLNPKGYHISYSSWNANSFNPESIIKVR